MHSREEIRRYSSKAAVPSSCSILCCQELLAQLPGTGHERLAQPSLYSPRALRSNMRVSTVAFAISGSLAASGNIIGAHGLASTLAGRCGGRRRGGGGAPVAAPAAGRSGAIVLARAVHLPLRHVYTDFNLHNASLYSPTFDASTASLRTAAVLGSVAALQQSCNSGSGNDVATKVSLPAQAATRRRPPSVLWQRPP